MLRSLLKIHRRHCSFNTHFSDITKFYNRIREDKLFSNPDHAYPKCLNKINFHAYRLIIDEYDTNIKPNTGRQQTIENIFGSMAKHGIRVELAEEKGYFSLVRETNVHTFTLRITNFIDDIKPKNDSEEEVELDTTQKIKMAKSVKLENEMVDERYFFKQNGKIVPPESLAYLRHIYKSENETGELVNPFELKSDSRNIIDFDFTIERKDKSVPSIKMDGFICD
jgi:hypothetical protein